MNATAIRAGDLVICEVPAGPAGDLADVRSMRGRVVEVMKTRLRVEWETHPDVIVESVPLRLLTRGALRVLDEHGLPYPDPTDQADRADRVHPTDRGAPPITFADGSVMVEERGPSAPPLADDEVAEIEANLRAIRADAAKKRAPRKKVT